ncbi:MAG: DNA primase catalytic subunit PriS [Candidatus Altiarchaeota archaeon]
METDTKIYLKKKFKEYYWRNDVPAPRDIRKREVGVGTLEDKIKFRHKSFKTEKEFRQYLKTEAPYYISYSIAYYEYPENQPMTAKNWTGADLVFDLDREIQWLNNSDLEAVKREAVSLIGFLTGDFGISEDEVRLNFSGSKGYHIHVFNDGLRTLGSDERREIIDYVTGTGLDLDCFIREAESPAGITYRRGKPKLSGGSWIGPGRGGKGWPARIYSTTKSLLESDKDVLRKNYGLSPQAASKIVKNRDANLEFLENGKWDAVFGVKSSLKKRVVEEFSVKDIEDADRMVTFDTTRLIRIPDTLHGSTGLKAAVVGDVDSFNPLVDAVVFGESEVPVIARADVGEFEMMGKVFGPYADGERVSPPEYAAVYLMLKGKADVTRA